MKNPNDWKSYADLIDPNDIGTLSSIYKDPKDLDVYVGGLFEKKDKPDSALGPTLRCFVADVFHK